MICTIGHSTRTAEAFLALIHAHSVTGVADVRTVPRSRRHPHFSREALSAFLARHGVAYLHLPGLGGLRKPRSDSPNGGWRHEAFRGYADHMATPEFGQALDELVAYSYECQAVVMCAEAKWWQCHRQLIADALVARGLEVRHIMSASEAPRHAPTPFARITGSTVDYPAIF
jgi:uncharacterized protein (DUF488 family)